MKVLVLGYGNPGRLDDGLGPALAEAVEEMQLPDVTADADYQLQPEDALRIAEASVVVFADAAVEGPEPFFFRPIEPRPGATFTTHHLDPEGLLAMAEETLGARTEAYVLGIRGYEFDEFGENLSSRGRENLGAAIRFLEPVLRERRFREAAGRGG
jgi:hydrogenase maturation protease